MELLGVYKKWRARQDRAEHPEGKFDKGGRWYPSDEEQQECCNSVRSPSRAWPHSLNKHCRSIEHVAALCDVTAADLRKEIARRQPRAKPQLPEFCFKAVAVVDDLFISIYDGRTQYEIGKTLRQVARPRHGGGYYVYATPEEARRAEVPNDCSAGKYPRVVLRVRVAGRRLRYDSGKLAYTEITPVAVL